MKGHAYAKINLGLQVLATLDNGYHDLDMIMMPLDLYDILTIEPNGSNQDHFFCNIGGKHFLHDNTVLDAIKLMRPEILRAICSDRRAHGEERLLGNGIDLGSRRICSDGHGP